MIVTRFDVIDIEDLNVACMLKNHKLARAIADMGFGEFRRQLEYKAAQRGKTVIVVNRWYPSSQTCSTCGHKVPQLPLSVREWTCPGCGTHHDRDINAAINLSDSGREFGEWPLTRVCLTTDTLGDFEAAALLQRILISGLLLDYPESQGSHTLSSYPPRKDGIDDADSRL